MDDNFRNALIIISAIIIAAIFVHGLWTIKKNKNPYKLKAKVNKGNNPEEFASSERGFDGAGFDQDGVSKARVVSVASLNEDEIPTQAAPAPEYDEEPLPKDVERADKAKPSLEPTLGDLSDISEQPPIDDTPPQAQAQQALSESEPEQEVKVTKQEPVYQTPVSQAKKVLKAAKNKTSKKASKKPVARNQMEINFGDEPVENLIADEDVQQTIVPVEVEEPNKITEPADIDPEVIVVSVVMPEGGVISGAALLPSLLTLGLKFGEMDIFHRHQDNAGKGKVTFSLANMMNPGTFDLDEMESFSTQGISLFMTLPNAGDPFDVFEQLMSAAKQLSVEFGAQLLDDKRSVMTKQTEQHYISKIRDFERRHRIALA